MHTILRNKIVIPENRQRQAFPEEQQSELTDSILRLGLQNPIVVAETSEGNFRLVSGERRLRSIDMIALLNIEFRCDGVMIVPSYVPCTLLTELDDIAREEAELDENIKRVDLTWQERAKAIARLQALREKQHGKWARNNLDGWPMSKTAVEVGLPESASTEVRDNVIIAEHLSDPEVAKAKNVKEAVKIVRKRKERELRALLAETYTETDDSIQLHHMEAKSLIANHIARDAIDCIIADPPYGIDADAFGSQSAVGHDYEDGKAIIERIMEWFPYETFEICRKSAHLYMFCSIENFFWLKERFTESSDWYVWPRPLIWSKGNGMLPQPDFGPRYTYECILFAIKGEKKVIYVADDVIKIQAVSGQLLKHAAQKPVELYTELLARSCMPGDTILDPFAGSFTAVIAAKRLKLNVIAGDSSESAYNMGVARVLEKEG